MNNSQNISRDGMETYRSQIPHPKSHSCGASMQPSWLAAFPELCSISDDAWLQALRMASEIDLPPNTVVIHKGDECKSFMLVIKGTVRVYERAGNGHELALYRVTAGEVCVLTIINLLEHTAYRADAVIEGEARVVSIPLPDFKNALAESPGFRNFIMSTLARRLSTVMHLVEQVAFQRLDLRLACLLGQLFGSRSTSHISITHQELANELGTAREVISRMLKEFEHMRCIRLHHGEIELVSHEALTRLTDIVER